MSPGGDSPTIVKIENGSGGNLRINGYGSGPQQLKKNVPQPKKNGSASWLPSEFVDCNGKKLG